MTFIMDTGIASLGGWLFWLHISLLMVNVDKDIYPQAYMMESLDSSSRHGEINIRIYE